MAEDGVILETVQTVFDGENHMKLGCVIMAAGAASRFGANKLVQDFLGKSLFIYALEAAADVFGKTAVVTGCEPVKAYAEKLGFTAVENIQPELGVSHTIRLGIEALGDCDGVLFMTADQPLLTRQTLKKLTEAFAVQPDCIHAAASGGVRGNPCLFPRDLLPELLALTADMGGGAVIRAHRDRLKLLEVPSEELLDCDTPVDLAICLEKAAKKLENRENTI